MKKIVFLLICLFSFGIVSKAELIGNETMAVTLDGYTIPTYYGIAGNSTTSVSFRFMFEDPEQFSAINPQYVVLSICSGAPMDNWSLTNTSKNSSWFDEFFDVYDTKKRCKMGNDGTGTLMYAQFHIGKWSIQDGLGVVVASRLHMTNPYSYPVRYDFNNVYLSTDDYLATLTINQGVENAIEDTNQKLDEAEKTRKGILGTLQSVFSKIADLPSLIWNAIKGGFEAITSGLTAVGNLIKTALETLGNFLIEGIKGLFVPTDEQLYEIIQDASNLSENFGFVGESVAFFINIFTALLGIVNANGCIELPEFTIGATTLFDSFTFWNAQNVCLADNAILSANINTIRTVTSIALVCLFLNFASRQFFSILSKKDSNDTSIYATEVGD